VEAVARAMDTMAHVHFLRRNLHAAVAQIDAALAAVSRPGRSVDAGTHAVLLGHRAAALIALKLGTADIADAATEALAALDALPPPPPKDDSRSPPAAMAGVHVSADAVRAVYLHNLAASLALVDSLPRRKDAEVRSAQALRTLRKAMAEPDGGGGADDTTLKKPQPLARRIEPIVKCGGLSTLWQRRLLQTRLVRQQAHVEERMMGEADDGQDGKLRMVKRLPTAWGEGSKGGGELDEVGCAMRVVEQFVEETEHLISGKGVATPPELLEPWDRSMDNPFFKAAPQPRSGEDTLDPTASNPLLLRYTGAGVQRLDPKLFIWTPLAAAPPEWYHAGVSPTLRGLLGSVVGANPKALLESRGREAKEEGRLLAGVAAAQVSQALTLAAAMATHLVETAESPRLGARETTYAEAHRLLVSLQRFLDPAMYGGAGLVPLLLHVWVADAAAGLAVTRGESVEAVELMARVSRLQTLMADDGDEHNTVRPRDQGVVAGHTAIGLSLLGRHESAVREAQRALELTKATAAAPNVNRKEGGGSESWGRWQRVHKGMPVPDNKKVARDIWSMRNNDHVLELAVAHHNLALSLLAAGDPDLATEHSHAAVVLLQRRPALELRDPVTGARCRRVFLGYQLIVGSAPGRAVPTPRGQEALAMGTVPFVSSRPGSANLPPLRRKSSSRSMEGGEGEQQPPTPLEERRGTPRLEPLPHGQAWATPTGTPKRGNTPKSSRRNKRDKA